MLLFRNIGRGWGAMVTALALFSLEAARELADLLERPGYYYEHKYLAIIVGVAAILLIAVLGVVINRDRVVFDQTLRRNTVVKNWHTLLFVPIQYWSIVIAFLLLVDLAHTA